MHGTSACSGTALADTVSGDFNLPPPNLLPRTPEFPVLVTVTRAPPVWKTLGSSAAR